MRGRSSGGSFRASGNCGPRDSNCSHKRASWWPGWLNSGGGGSPVVPSPDTWYGKDGDQSLVAFFDPSNPFFNYAGLVSSPGGIEYADSYAQDDGDLVTHVLLYGLAGLHMASAVTRSPTLGSHASVKSRVRFDSSGSTDYFQFASSTKILKKIHEANSHFTFAHKSQRVADGVAEYILSNNDNSTGSHGFNTVITAANKLSFSTTYGSAGNFKFNFLSTETITVADGLYHWEIAVAGSGATAGKFRLWKNGTLYTETFAVSANGSNNDASYDARYGRRQTAGNTLNSYESGWYIRNTADTEEQFLAWVGYNPDRQIRETFVEYVDINADFNVFSDNGLSVPIADGGLVRTVKSRTPYPFGDPLRFIQASADAQRGLFTLADPNINGHSSLQWHGSDMIFPGNNTNYTSQNGAFSSGQRPIWTHLQVVRNTKTTPGSHPYAGQSSNYVANVGTNHTGNPIPGQPEYNVHHFGDTVSIVSLHNRIPQKWNVFMECVNMMTGEGWSMNGAGVVTYKTGIVSEPTEIVLHFGRTWKDPDPGEDGGWWMKGDQYTQKRWYGAMTPQYAWTNIMLPLINELNFSD